MLKNLNLSNEKQQLARATLIDLTHENMKKQIKAVHYNCSTQSENSFKIKSEPSYVAVTKSEQPTLFGNNSYSNWEDSIIIDGVE